MRSHISTASSMLWVTSRIDEIGMRPSHHRSSRSVRSVSAVSTSSAENGSSISSTSGCTTSARAKPDALAHAARQLLRDRRSRSRRGRSGRSPPARACGARAGGTRCASRPISTFSSTVSQGKSAKVWNTIATSRAGPVDRPAADRHRCRRSAGIRPAMMRSSVDLPQPERPSSATISLLRRRRLTSSSTSRSLAAALGIELGGRGRRRAGRAVERRCPWRILLNPDGSGVRPGDRAAATAGGCTVTTMTDITPMPSTTRG